MFRIVACCVFLFSFFSMSAYAADFSQRPDVQQFIHTLVIKDNFNEAKLNALFSGVHPNPKIIDLMTKPAEKKPWYAYRKIFISEKRIQNGLVFWKKNARVLKEAQAIYGVPASIIVAIIGVETSYGDNRGNISTLDALSTLAFDYPRRAEFFQKELREFLLLTRDMSADPRAFYGSYAGAIGYPQFMPSSYRKYGIDFNNNQVADLLNDPVDAIGSVANYLKRHGWRSRAPIAMHAKVKGNDFQTIGKDSLTISQMEKRGVKPAVSVSPDLRAGFLELEGEDGKEYWLVFKNFYVIKSYNSSSLYAMAVYQLSNLLEQRRGESVKKAASQA